MKRNYNGNVNHSILRELEDLCNLNSENRKILMCEFIEKGELSFSVNTNPITGVPSEELKVCTLKSEEEITEFLKQDFEEKLTRYLNGKNIKDYLLIILIEFSKKSNGVFPNKDEMKQIQKEAEAKRIATLPSPSNSNKQKEITDTDIKLEILQLVEEIMESRRKSNKNDIFIHVEPYSERLGIQTDDFYGNIFHEKL